MTTWLLIVSIVTAALAAVPVGLGVWNLVLFRAPRKSWGDGARTEAVSVLIPARDEEASVGACVRAVLASRGVDVEVIVLDDSSQDATAAVVREIAAGDARVRLETAPKLPAGWCGKQHACHVLSRLAKHELMLFIDADVRLEPDAVARAVRFMAESSSDLVSGFPRQETGTFLEKLLIPLVHFVLLEFLPVFVMRKSKDPSFGAGCGQFVLVRRGPYEATGGHAAIRASMHDGIMLPRAFRRAGFRTDIFDATDMGTCRMYRSAGEVWRGLSKNASEGMASRAAIGPWTILLVGGQVVPVVLLMMLLLIGNVGEDPSATRAAYVCACAIASNYLLRLLMAIRFQHSLLGVALHTFGVLTLMSIQWVALTRSLFGRPARWRGRDYPSGGFAAAGAPQAGRT